MENNASHEKNDSPNKVRSRAVFSLEPKCHSLFVCSLSCGHEFMLSETKKTQFFNEWFLNFHFPLILTVFASAMKNYFSLESFRFFPAAQCAPTNS